jgi:hypothetical protein
MVRLTVTKTKDDDIDVIPYLDLPFSLVPSMEQLVHLLGPAAACPNRHSLPAGRLAAAALLACTVGETRKTVRLIRPRARAHPTPTSPSPNTRRRWPAALRAWLAAGHPRPRESQVATDAQRHKETEQVGGSGSFGQQQAMIRVALSIARTPPRAFLFFSFRSSFHSFVWVKRTRPFQFPPSCPS